jgi:hypothetical protein
MSPSNSSSSSTPYMPQETESTLPGIKRGIAIGVACSVSIILIAILAFFAIRRRNRVLKRNRLAGIPKIEHIEAEAWPQEKAWWTAPTPPSPPLPIPIPIPSPPPVEADARTIYELDADQIPELPNHTIIHQTEIAENDKENEDDAYAQKLKQWKAWSIAIDPEPTNARPTSWRLPLLTISPPEESRDDVSPLLNSRWSFDASPVLVSPPPSAHFLGQSP